MPPVGSILSKSWSNSGGAAQNVTVDQNAVTNGLRLTAVYSVLNRVVVQSNPPGLALQVDGATCQTPCNIDRKNGAQIHVTAPPTIAMGSGARLDFSSWSDGGASDHSYTVSQNSTTITANYQNAIPIECGIEPGQRRQLPFLPGFERHVLYARIRRSPSLPPRNPASSSDVGMER